MSQIFDEYMGKNDARKKPAPYVDGWRPKQSREVLEREHRISRRAPHRPQPTHSYPQFKIIAGWLILVLFIIWCLNVIYSGS